MTIAGIGSEVRISPTFGTYLAPEYAGANGYTDIGRNGGNGRLIVESGASFIQENIDGTTDGGMLRFGRSNGDYGYGAVRDTGSSLVIRQIGAIGDSYGSGARLRVGDNGQGILKVESGATLSVLGAGATLVVADGDFNGSGSETSAQSLLEITGGSQVSVDSQAYTGSISSGEAFYNGAQLRISSGINSNGRVVVDGPDSRLDIVSPLTQANDYSSGQLRVGVLGAGHLEVSNFSQVTASELEVGAFSRGINTTGQEVTTFDDLQSVFHGSYGSVEITTGGSINVTASDYTPYRGVNAGISTGSVGIINVDGAGSELVSTGGAGRIQIGRFGDGTLNISSGGAVKGFYGGVGTRYGGRGYVKVDGVGSLLLMSDAYGAFQSDPDDTFNVSGEAGFLRLGRNAGSHGELQITGGGRVEITNDPADNKDLPALDIARNAGSTGYLLVDGSDEFGTASQLNISMSGSSTDAFSRDGSFYAGPQLKLGDSRDSAAGGGSGTAVVRNGGQINITGENAELRVGVGSSNTSFAYSSSSLAIESGAMVELRSIGNEAGAFVILGQNATGVGTLTLDGAGSELRLMSDNIDNIMIDGEDSYGAALIAGSQGDGSLIIRNGASVIVDGADDLFPGVIIGRGSSTGTTNAFGAATLTGAASTLDIIGNHENSGALLGVGLFDGATGEFSVLDGGVATLSSTGTSAVGIAPNVGATGDVTVSGVGSRIDAGTLLLLGADRDNQTLEILPDQGGTGTLTIDDGGVVSADLTTIGNSGVLNLSASLVQSGSTARLVNHGTIHVGGVGDTGSGTLVGDLDNTQDGDVIFEVDGFHPGQYDVLNLSAGDGINLSGSGITIDISGLDQVQAGDRAVILSAMDFTLPSLDLFGFTLLGSNDNIVFDLRQTGDEVALVAVLETITGTEDPETLLGTEFDEVIYGLGGDDLLDGVGGVDHLFGGAGNDTVEGGPGADSIDGGSGDDVLNGGGGNDSILGEDGNDVIYGGAGDDTLTDGFGDDVVYGGDGDDLFRIFTGNDTFDGGAGNDTIFIDLTNNTTSTLTGFVNLVTGESGAIETLNLRDSIAGIENVEMLGSWDFVVTGDSSNNAISTDSGNDTVEGGAGADSMDGGAGNDTLSYESSSSGVTVNLDTGSASGGDATGDVFSNFEHLIGSDNDDSLTGNGDDNSILGLAGNDTIDGLAGNDTIEGGAGADSMDGGLGVDTLSYEHSSVGVAVSLDTGSVFGGDVIANFEHLIGSVDADDLTGDDSSNSLSGLSGNDTLAGNLGNDTLDGGLGSDRMEGGLGDDRFFVDSVGDVVIEGPGEGRDTIITSVTYTLPENVEVGSLSGSASIGLTGNALANTITGNVGNNNLRGSSGADRLLGSNGNDVLDGGSGNDQLYGGSGNDVLRGSAGNDLLDGGSGNDKLYGGTNNDVLRGSSGRDLLDGGSGNDKLYGGSSNDVLKGGSGKDRLDGGSGNDKLYGGNSNDVLKGGSGKDTLDGGSGNDKLFGGNSNDVLKGKNGKDTLDGGSGKDKLFGGNSNDVLKGKNGKDTLDGGNGNDKLFGGNSNDVLKGGNGKDILKGDRNNDELFGDKGNDKIYGGHGKDDIIGGRGNDQLFGGAGSDTFIFTAGHGKDTIRDMKRNDTIDVSALANSFSDLTITSSGGDARIKTGGGTVILDGVDADDISASWFEFG